MCGICTEAVSVTRPVADRRRRARRALPAASRIWRRERTSISTTSAARANAAAAPVSIRPSTSTLPAACGWTSGAPGSSAASTSTTASSGSRSTTTCSARSSASAAEAAITAAIGRRRSGPDLRQGSAARSPRSRADAAAAGSPDAGEIGRREHGGPAGAADPQDTTAGHRAAHEVERRGAGGEVGDEAAAPGDERMVLGPRDRSADPAHAASARSKPARHHPDQVAAICDRPWMSSNGSTFGGNRSRLRPAPRSVAAPSSACSASLDPQRPVAGAADPDPRLDDGPPSRRSAASAMLEGEVARAPAELGKAEAPVRPEHRQAHLRDQLVGSSEVVRIVRKNAAASIVRSPSGHAPGSRHRASSRPRTIRRRVGVRQAAGERAAHADRQVGDVAHHIGEQVAQRALRHRSFEARVPGERADAQRAILVVQKSSSAMRLMSTRTAGRASRKFIAGTRLWPPARSWRRRPAPPAARRPPRPSAARDSRRALASWRGPDLAAHCLDAECVSMRCVITGSDIDCARARCLTAGDQA